VPIKNRLSDRARTIPANVASRQEYDLDFMSLYAS
jgi:hypothetical protein